METNPACWFEVYVQDMERAKKFYESVFQVKLVRLDTPQMEIWSFPMKTDRFGAGGALVKMPGVSSGGNSVLVYFGCIDSAVETARVVQSGGKVEKEKMSIGQYGFIALVYDTEGNMFGLHSLH